MCSPRPPRPPSPWQVSDVLEQWVALQRAWMYLEPVFASGDIQQQVTGRQGVPNERGQGG